MASHSCTLPSKSICLWPTQCQCMASAETTQSAKQWTQDFLQRFYSRKQFSGFLWALIIARTIGEHTVASDFPTDVNRAMALMGQNLQREEPESSTWNLTLSHQLWKSTPGSERRTALLICKRSGYHRKCSRGLRVPTVTVVRRWRKSRNKTSMPQEVSLSKSEIQFEKSLLLY